MKDSIAPDRPLRIFVRTFLRDKIEITFDIFHSFCVFSGLVTKLVLYCSFG